MDIPLPDLAATEAFAARLAAQARAGDCFALYGDLGAGKTSFARAFIRALAGAETEVPSPTYTLVQHYDARLGEGSAALITHADLYRVKSACELDEIGLADAFDRSITLIEWPDVAAQWLPPSHVALHFLQDNGARIVRCKAGEGCYISFA